jgi:hypothetical protein
MENAPPRPSPLGQTVLTPPPSSAEIPNGSGGVELIVVDEQRSAPTAKKPWRAAEVWTRRRVYRLDATFKCVEVTDRETGAAELGHDMLGARLSGGRLREKEGVRFAYPLPLPGMEAMFMKGRKHGYTSAVERMIVRIRVLQTMGPDAVPSWEELGVRWSDPPPP